MTKIKHKVYSGLMLIGCAAAALGAASILGKKSENGALPVSLISNEDEKPVIVIDAGHGEST